VMETGMVSEGGGAPSPCSGVSVTALILLCFYDPEL
jgi:hypothetical protein